MTAKQYADSQRVLRERDQEEQDKLDRKVGTRKIKLSNGKVLEMPARIRPARQKTYFEWK